MIEETVTGIIISGQKLGRKIGFPTINLRYDGDLRGVFVGELVFNELSYGVAVNLGGRPTVGDEGVYLEAHLLDFKSFLIQNPNLEQKNGSFVGKIEVSVNLLKKIRSVQKFNSINELKKQINKDVEFTRSWYNHREIN